MCIAGVELWAGCVGDCAAVPWLSHVDTDGNGAEVDAAAGRCGHSCSTWRFRTEELLV